MAAPVFILGGYQTDFAEKLSPTGQPLADLIQRTANGALDACQTDASGIGSAHVGNFISELYCGQSHLAGLLAEVVPGLREKPISRHEAACASGSMAALAAMAEIEAGRVETSLVLGVEAMRHVDSRTGAGHLAQAAWVGPETDSEPMVWPWMFSEIIEEYGRRYGIDHRHLAAIGRKNFHNARRNPNAQTRGWEVTDQTFDASGPANPVIAGRLQRYDCAQITDGGAGVVLASETAARAHAKRNNLSLEAIPRILGWGHRTARLGFREKLADSQGAELIFPHVRHTIIDAFGRAGINDVWSLQGIETHDCFTISEYMAIDHFGITDPGNSWQAIEDETLQLGGRLPINSSGGLIGLGHPVGASGVRMLLDAAKQVGGTAGDYQVEGARRFATLNIGGSTTSVACFVVGR